MSELYHHGILGMKWGIRRYQNKDGSLTAEGKKRYGTDITQVDEKFVQKQIKGLQNKNKSYYKEYRQKIAEYGQKVRDFREHSADVKRRDEIYTKQIENMMNGDDDITEQEYEELGIIETKLNNQMNKLISSFIDDIAGIQVSSLGYDNNKKAREFIFNLDPHDLFLPPEFIEGF